MLDDPRDPDTSADGIGSLLARAVEDAREVARAELDVLKAKARARLGEARNGAILLVSALLLGSMAATGLVVGALMSLAPLVGPLGATGIVVGVLLVVAGLLGWLAVGHFKALLKTGESAK